MTTTLNLDASQKSHPRPIQNLQPIPFQRTIPLNETRTASTADRLAHNYLKTFPHLADRLTRGIPELTSPLAG